MPATRRHSRHGARRGGVGGDPPGTVRVRKATPRDVPAILRLIRGLAAFERLSHEVTATAARLRRHGFGRRPYFEAMLCIRGRGPIGFALYFFTYSTFLARPTLYLEDLFVLPEERGNGAGALLLATLAREALRHGCGRMEWAVLDWNADALRFYRRLGAKIRREWLLTRLAGTPLRLLAARATTERPSRARRARPRG